MQYGDRAPNPLTHFPTGDQIALDTTIAAQFRGGGICMAVDILCLTAFVALLLCRFVLVHDIAAPPRQKHNVFVQGRAELHLDVLVSFLLFPAFTSGNQWE